MSAPLTTRIQIRDPQGRVIEEREVATYAGLLARAHEEGLKVVETTLIQVPSEENRQVAIARATVETHRGTFTGIGDACPGNVNRRIAPHLIRMAETRAKARALRDAVNIGVVALEELGEGNGFTGEGLDSSTNGRPSAGSARPISARAVSTTEAKPASAAMSEGQTASPEARPTSPEPVYVLDPEAQAEPPLAPASPAPRSITMSEAQRRLLFRLLSEAGHTGEVAKRILCEFAGVAEVRDVTKSLASSIIDEWKNRGVRPADNGQEVSRAS